MGEETKQARNKLNDVKTAIANLLAKTGGVTIEQVLVSLQTARDFEMVAGNALMEPSYFARLIALVKSPLDMLDAAKDDLDFYDDFKELTNQLGTSPLITVFRSISAVNVNNADYNHQLRMLEDDAERFGIECAPLTSSLIVEELVGDEDED